MRAGSAAFFRTLYSYTFGEAMRRKPEHHHMPQNISHIIRQTSGWLANLTPRFVEGCESYWPGAEPDEYITSILRYNQEITRSCCALHNPLRSL